jgi:hypothetical protein
VAGSPVANSPQSAVLFYCTRSHWQLARVVEGVELVRAEAEEGGGLESGEEVHLAHTYSPQFTIC